MRHIVLSDHTTERLNQREKEREKEYKKGLETYNSAMLERKRRIEKAKEELIKVWMERKVWRIIINFLKWLYEKTSSKPVLPVKKGTDEEDNKWEAGRSGQKMVEDYLSGMLNDEWVLISGYNNYKGEIDGVLAGPEGIFAIEIKYHNGTFFCKGDRWWFDKYDKYGNLVNWDNPVEDNGGRSPSRQLNEPADLLQTYLRNSNHSVKIYRIVLLSHDRSEIGEMEELTVDEVVTLSEWDLNRTFKKNNFKLSPADVEEIVKVIKSSHRKKNGHRNNSRRNAFNSHLIER